MTCTSHMTRKRLTHTHGTQVGKKRLALEIATQHTHNHKSIGSKLLVHEAYRNPLLQFFLILLKHIWILSRI